MRKTREFLIGGAGTAIVAECSLAASERSLNLTGINDWLSMRGYVYRATALDCNGDGQPDS